MLLTSGAVPSGDVWTFEVKWDGCRAQLRYDKRSVSLRTRSGRECSGDFPELVGIAGALGKRRVILDAELVRLRDDGRPDFARVRNRLVRSLRRKHPAMLQVFDILHLDGLSTRPLPYASAGRCSRSWSSTVLPGVRQQALWLRGARTSSHMSASFASRALVAKRLSSTYIPGRRCKAWVKHKLRRNERLAVTGIRRNREGYVEAIFVGRRPPDGSLTGAGAVELGLHRELTEALERRLAKLPARRRGAVALYPDEVSVIASLHGFPDEPVRDAVLREVLDGAVATT
jgi:bifunctional non-homologous end joining protein LigD